jgi:hypothetical protein
VSRLKRDQHALRAELLDEWPEIDPETAKLIRVAISSQDRPRMRFV